MVQCNSKTMKGTRCQRDAIKGRKMCLQHAKVKFGMKDGRPSIYEFLHTYMERVHNKDSLSENFNFVDENGREVFLQLKWFKGSPGVNGDLIIKVVSIKPRGGNAITLAVDELLKCKDAVKWGLNKVVMESILDRELFEKLKLRGWVERPGIYNNLYRYAPHYREPTLEDILKMRGMRS